MKKLIVSFFFWRYRQVESVLCNIVSVELPLQVIDDCHQNYILRITNYYFEWPQCVVCFLLYLLYYSNQKKSNNELIKFSHLTPEFILWTTYVVLSNDTFVTLFPLLYQFNYTGVYLLVSNSIKISVLLTPSKE